MNVLRRIISPMGTMDGIEFLISKIKDTKNNSDFFNSMNKSKLIYCIVFFHCLECYKSKT